MPLREFECKQCRKSFELLVRGDEPALCPGCGGEDLIRHLSVFAVNRGPAEAAPAPGGCGRCGDPRGPGSCALDG